MEIEYEVLNLSGCCQDCSSAWRLVRGQMLSWLWTLQGFSEPCCEDEVQEGVLRYRTYKAMARYVPEWGGCAIDIDLRLQRFLTASGCRREIYQPAESF